MGRGHCIVSFLSVIMERIIKLKVFECFLIFLMLVSVTGLLYYPKFYAVHIVYFRLISTFSAVFFPLCLYEIFLIYFTEVKLTLIVFVFWGYFFNVSQFCTFNNVSHYFNLWFKCHSISIYITKQVLLRNYLF